VCARGLYSWRQFNQRSPDESYSLKKLFRRINMFRRHNVVLFVLVLALLALAVPPGISSAQADNVDVYGRTLPKDAAPYHQQIWTELCNAARKETSLSSAVTVYTRICDQDGFDKFGDSLVVLDENLDLKPAAADSWEP